MIHDQKTETSPEQTSSELQESTDSARFIVAAICRSNAVIEFRLDGTIVWANQNFLDTMGYTLDEIAGQHHRLFVEPAYAASAEYQQFWEELRSGRFQAAEYKRIGKGGKEVWLQATYNPVLNQEGKPIKVLQVASNVTEQKLISVGNANQLAAIAKSMAIIDKSMAVIEFQIDGTIIRANDIFVELMGYTKEELAGRHHRIFVDPEEAAGEGYARFWEDLANGHFRSGQFKRIAKNGTNVFLAAAYSPIPDVNGKPCRVIKCAYDVTAQFNQAMAIVGEKSAALEKALAEAQEAERIRQEMDRTLQEMSTPVTPIWDQVLLLPLVGIIDSQRTSDVMRKTLMRIRETGSKMFILDISGVPTVDTAVANQFIKITKATKLMGCETVISGVSPAIAHTVVELGVDVGDVKTTATLRDAFEVALRQISKIARQQPLDILSAPTSAPEQA